MKKPVWIWYFGDFEMWLNEKLIMRRDQRGCIQVPFWRMDSYWHKINFSKNYTLEAPAVIRVYSTGLFNIAIDDAALSVPQNPDGSYTIPAGSGRLIVDVYSDNTLPSIFVDGDERLYSGADWFATYNNSQELHADCGEFDTPENPPTNYRLACERMPYAAKKAAVAVGRDMRLSGTLYDFGVETFGYITLDGISGSGRIYVLYGETEAEAMSIDYCETFDCVDTDGSAVRRINRSRAMRYVFVGSTSAQVDDISFEYEYNPLPRRGSFKCSDELINRIYDVSYRTFHLTAREFFIDGIKRDRWVWGGDAYQSCLMNFYSFADAGICRRTLTALPGKQPFERHINHIMDYSFYWFIALRDYLLFTGDSGFIGKIYPTAKAFMDFCLSQSNEKLLMYNKPHDWIFVDWADMEKEGALCVEQVLFCAALKSMAEIASAAGKAPEAEHYTGLSEQLMEEIIRIYWDDDKGCFIHSIGDYGICTDITRYANMFALMYSLVDGDKCRKIAENVLKNDDAPPVGTPYARFYELDALCASGEHRYVLDEMRSYWGGMLELGATSFWEKFSRNDSGAAHYEMYERPFGKSLCHAWGASPLYLLGKHFLGVTPSENGFSRFVARPQLCDLEFIEGSVPVSGGSVHIFASRDEIRIKSDSAPGVLYFESEKSPTASRGEIKRCGEEYMLELDAGIEYTVCR